MVGENDFQKGEYYEALANYEAETYTQFTAGQKYLCLGKVQEGFVRFQANPAHPEATPQPVGLRGETLKKIFG